MPLISDFSKKLDLLEGEQNSSVREFDNAQNEHVFSRVIVSFVHHIWLYLHVFVAKWWKSVYASKYSQVQEKWRKTWRNEEIMHIRRITRKKPRDTSKNWLDQDFYA